MELLILILLVAFAVVLAAGGLLLSRRSARVERSAGETDLPETDLPETDLPETGTLDQIERVTPRLRDRLGKTRAAFAGVFAGISGSDYARELSRAGALDIYSGTGGALSEKYP